MFFPFVLDTSNLEACLQTELHLYTEQSQNEEKTPVPPTSSVLLAFSILGELHTKLKSFGKTYTTLCHLHEISEGPIG